MQPLDWSVEAKRRFAALLDQEIWEILSSPNKRLSQNRLGEKFGVAGSTVQSWLEGSIPETPKLKKIAATLGWSLDDLHNYLQKGIRPEKNQVDRIVYELGFLNPQDLALIAQASITCLADLKAS